jgi:DNA-binding NtrC family response regulator
MDDEEAIRRLSKQVLSRLGFEPELANDGAEAIKLFKESMDSGKLFDAVILDLTIKGGMGVKIPFFYLPARHNLNILYRVPHGSTNNESPSLFKEC